ncbi:MAG: DUF1385 domain-containing protein [Oscillospiraceae bacterium]
MDEKKKVHKTSIGGQALIEGVMMRGVDNCAMATRMPSGEIDVEMIPIKPSKEIPRIAKLPVVRGVVNFVSSLRLGYKCLMKSAEKAGLDDEEEGEPSKFEQKLEQWFGDKLMRVVSGVGMVLGLVLAIVLFMYLPSLAVKGLELLLPLGVFKAVVEGIIKIAVFVGYLAVVSRMGEIARVFEYHGAEHKTIACYEHGEALTPENVKKYTRFHPRCGTSFILIILVISILVFSFVTWSTLWVRILLKLALLPLVVGVGYELIKVCGRYDNPVTRAVSKPGLWLQRLTTREPDEEQIAVAIASLQAVLPKEGEDDRW